MRLTEQETAIREEAIKFDAFDQRISLISTLAREIR